MKKKHKSLIKSFSYAFSGIVQVYKYERNIRIETLIGILSLLMCWYYQVTRLEWMIVLICCMVVLSLECLNSAIEKTIDLASPQYQKLAEMAKDFSAGAVLLASILAAVIGIILFFPYWQITFSSL